MPLAAAPLKNPQAAIAAGPSTAHPLISRRYRILVVDDNEVNCRILALQLEKFGYASITAGGGKEALAVLEKDPVDLIFMDCQMPELDGYETTRLIREKESTLKRRPVVVAMTANAMEGDRQKCLQAGMDDYVAKPARIEDLGRVLASWDTPLKIAAVNVIREMAGKDFAAMLKSFLTNSGRLAQEASAAVETGAGPKRSSRQLGGPGLSPFR